MQTKLSPLRCVLLRITHTHRTGAAQTSCDPVGRCAQMNRWVGNPDYTGKLLCPCSRSFHRSLDRSRSFLEHHSGRLGKEQWECVIICGSQDRTFLSTDCRAHQRLGTTLWSNPYDQGNLDHWKRTSENNDLRMEYPYKSNIQHAHKSHLNPLMSFSHFRPIFFVVVEILKNQNGTKLSDFSGSCYVTTKIVVLLRKKLNGHKK